VMVNRKKLDELPAASRDAVIRAAAAAEERGWSLSERSASETLTVLKNSGAKIGVIGGSVRPRLDRAGGILSAEAMKRADPELFALLTQYLALK